MPLLGHSCLGVAPAILILLGALYAAKDSLKIHRVPAFTFAGSTWTLINDFLGDAAKSSLTGEWG